MDEIAVDIYPSNAIEVAEMQRGVANQPVERPAVTNVRTHGGGGAGQAYFFAVPQRERAGRPIHEPNHLLGEPTIENRHPCGRALATLMRRRQRQRVGLLVLHIRPIHMLIRDPHVGRPRLYLSPRLSPRYKE